MRILVTGGAGFIGSHLAENLLENGHSIQVIDDLSTGSLDNIAEFQSNPNFCLAIETIRNETVMDRLVSECGHIYHLAAAVGVNLIIDKPVETIETNILGTEMVLKVAKRYRKPVFISSSSEVYGKNGNVPFSENNDCVYGSTTNQRWCYACSKAIDEYLALAYKKKYGLPIIIGRFFNTIGPRQTGQYGMVVPRFIKQALSADPITVYGDGKQKRCFGYVKDVVKAIISLMGKEKAVGEIFNIGSTEEISIEDLAIKIRDRVGSSSPITYIPYDVAYEKGFEDMPRRVPDVTKLKEITGLGIETSLSKIINEILAHYDETRRL